MLELQFQVATCNTYTQLKEDDDDDDDGGELKAEGVPKQAWENRM